MTTTQPTEPKFRVVAISFRGERVVRQGLTREAALELRDRMAADPIVRGISFSIEAEAPKVDAAIQQMAQVHGGVHRGGELPQQPTPAAAPIAVQTATTIRIRIDEERAQMEEARVARANREEFTFTAYNPGEWLCETASGNAYLVRESGACVCPDAQYRSNPRGLRCKHSIALGGHLLQIGALPSPAAPKRNVALAVA